ncbi:phospholipase D-like domain-containing protein [Endozoicomonadaceae bacterium StTr2]
MADHRVRRSRPVGATPEYDPGTKPSLRRKVKAFIARQFRTIRSWFPTITFVKKKQQPHYFDFSVPPESIGIRQRRGFVVRPNRQHLVRGPEQQGPGPINPEAVRMQRAVTEAATGCSQNGSIPESLVTTYRNTVESVAIGGDEIFDSFSDVIRGARQEVLIQTFSWEPNSPGVQKHIIPALRALQREAHQHPERFRLPLKIKILVNQARGPAAKFMKRKKGNRAPTIENLLPGFKPDRRLLDVRGGVHANRLTDGLHSKTVVADGCRAAITGANIQRRNHAGTEGRGLAAYDTGTVVRGEVGMALRSGFMHNWVRGLDARDKPNRQVRPLRYPPDFSRDPELTATPITVLTRKANPNIAERSIDCPQSQGLLTAINEAEKRIAIQSPNLNNAVLIKALATAVERGVKVELLLSKRFNEQRESAMGAGGTNAEAVSKLFQLCGHPNPNLDIRWYVPPGDTEPVEENKPGEGASHAKFASFDDHMVVVGSANMDNQSWYYADETSLAISGKDNTCYIRDRLFQPAFDRSQPVTNP